MPKRTVWCRNPHCGKSVEIMWHVPDICPNCNRAGLWTTQQPAVTDDPIIPWVLTNADRMILKARKIDPDGTTDAR